MLDRDSGMSIADAQADLRRAYVGGGPGLVVSGLFWLIAAYVTVDRGLPAGFVVLFVTGMLIFPSAVLLRKFVFRREPEAAGNPMGRIALESTIAMLGGLVISWMLLESRPHWAFPLAAIAVGTHFFAFRTAYGDARFWLLGALLTALGFGALFWPGIGGPLPVLVGVMEIAFGLWLAMSAGRAKP